jgi:hypothetical protein
MKHCWMCTVAALAACTGDVDSLDLGEALEAPETRGQGDVAGLRHDDTIHARGVPALSGGTLAALADGARVWISDPDRDRGLFVDTDAGAVVREIRFSDGAEPGRAAEDAAGRVHVVLRGAGSIASIDPSGAMLARPVCAMPRGIAYDRAHERLHVVCRDGDLVSLSIAGEETRRATLEPDLRDVVMVGDDLFITTFRHAEVLRVGPDGKLVDRISLDPAAVEDGPTARADVAWRMIAAGDGVAVVHQLALTSMGGGYGPPPGQPCPTSRVQSTVTFVDGAGRTETTAPWVGVVLPVDVAIHAGEVAVVSAGSIGDGDSRVVRHERTAIAGATCITSGADEIDHEGRAVAVAFDARGRLLVQLREPAALWVGDRAIDLGGVPVLDRGHELFHTSAVGMTDIAARGGGATPAAVACASCHAEGADDGQVWDGMRTQSLEGGVSGTEPFHWAGEMPDLDALALEVFTRRMGGRVLAPDEVGALARWMDSIPRPAPMAIRDLEAAARGRELFMDPEHGCYTCHAGERFMNRVSFDVGRGSPMQVPPLAGVIYRAPFMHDGCAPALADRFDPGCGGFEHGGGHLLYPYEREALVAYLSSL